MATSYPQVVLLGDSLFQMSVAVQEGFSFHSALQSHCLRRLDVVNRGFNGWNSRLILQFLPDMIPPPKEGSPHIKYLVLLIGANDATVPMEGIFQNIPLDEYRANVRAIVTHPNVAAHGATVLLVTPPPVDELSRVPIDVETCGLAAIARHASRTAEYAHAVREIASAVAAEGTVDVQLVDLWQALHDRAIKLTPDWTPPADDKPWLGTLASGTSGGFKELLSDGLHMNGNGYKVFYDLLVQYILPGADLTDWRTWVYPGWMELCKGAVKQERE